MFYRFILIQFYSFAEYTVPYSYMVRMNEYNDKLDFLNNIFSSCKKIRFDIK